MARDYVITVDHLRKQAQREDAVSAGDATAEVIDRVAVAICEAGAAVAERLERIEAKLEHIRETPTSATPAGGTPAGAAPAGSAPTA